MASPSHHFPSQSIPWLPLGILFIFCCLAAIGHSAPTTLPALQPVGNRRPIPKPVDPPAEDLTDAQIERSIRRGGNYLIKRFDKSTLQVHVPRSTRIDSYVCGLDALHVYALMQIGLALDEPELGPRGKLMQGMIDRLKRLPAEVGTYQTYAHALRATALSVFNRPEDRATLEEDVQCLLIGHSEGAYTYYSAQFPRRGHGGGPTYKALPIWDNSNSQYGLFGVWSGADAGVEVPEDYWPEIEQHWTRHQLADGRWSYTNRGSPVAGMRFPPEFRSASPSMTAAGIASLFVVRDYTETGREARRVGKPPFPPALDRAMAWWETGDNSVDYRNAWMSGYWLFGVERVGLASGFKYFGKHDWYRTLAKYVIGRQLPDGSWKPFGALKDEIGNDVETAYSLLFLARARHPILMNKLRFDGYWSNRPRDLPALARFAAKRLERPLNWQVVPINRDWSDWTDAPVLYLASQSVPNLKEADYDNLRAYALSGGLIFTHTDEDAAGSGERFNEWVEKTLARKLFPQYEMSDLPADHPIYNFPAKVRRRTPLRGIGNGWRLLLVHSTKDLAYRWQTRDEKAEEDAFQTGLNLFVYAAGTRDFRKRLEPTFIPPPPGRQTLTVPVARLKYAGAWDPEPYAWERCARQVQWNTSYQLDVKPIDWKSLKVDSARFAHLTGAVRYDPTPDEAAALKNFVESGGVLLIDDCGGRGEFAKSMRKALTAIWPQTSLRPMDAAARPLTVGEAGMIDLGKPKLRAANSGKVDPAAAAAKWLAAGRGHVVFCDVDVTCGLLGANTAGLRGYEPNYAQSLVQNLLLWTLDGQPTGPLPPTRPAE